MGLGRPSAPGPGFTPFAAGLSLVFLSFLLLLQNLFKEAGGSWETRILLRNLAWVLGGMALYGFLLPKIGFVLDRKSVV